MLKTPATPGTRQTKAHTTAVTNSEPTPSAEKRSGLSSSVTEGASSHRPVLSEVVTAKEDNPYFYSTHRGCFSCRSPCCVAHPQIRLAEFFQNYGDTTSKALKISIGDQRSKGQLLPSEVIFSYCSGHRFYISEWS